MAIDDLQVLHEPFPEAFDQKPLPPDWKDWRVLPINAPGSVEPHRSERDLLTWESEQSPVDFAEDRPLPNIPAF